MHSLKIGDVFESELIVEEKHTASAFGSGDLYVFSTPMMIGLMENAAMNCAQEKLEEKYSTVGMSVDILHTAATPMGHGVRAVAELVAIDGKKLTFKVQAFDEAERIGTGMHERYIIDRARFMDKLTTKRGGHEND